MKMLYTLISRRKSVLLSLGCFFLLIGPCLAQVITVPVPTASCHGNGTPDITTDDYMTFTINASETPVVLNTFTVTATQNGNPLAVTLSNGSPATAVLDGLDTPLRTPAGSAGLGNVTLTIRDNTNNATTTVVVTDPGTCGVPCLSGATSTLSYQYGTQIDPTELANLPIILPRFDQSIRTLTSARLEYTLGAKTSLAFENRGTNPETFEATASVRIRLNLNNAITATETVALDQPSGPIGAGVAVPASPPGWPGDVGISTLAAMPWISDYLNVFKDPRNDPRWVTTATTPPNIANDDDIVIVPLIEASNSNSRTYTGAELASFIGAGNVPLDVITLSGISILGGGGNIAAAQRTRAFANVRVIYTYVCSVLPVSLISFTAQKENQIAVLSWSTAEEINSDRFEVEHSLNGKNWQKIGSVAAKGNSSNTQWYSFTDNDPANGSNLYRLRIVDRDGTFEITRAKSLTFDIGIETVVYPNPVTERLLLKTSDLSRIRRVELYDASGKSVLESETVTASGIDVKGLPTGLYVIKVTRTNGSTDSFKIVKQ